MKEQILKALKTKFASLGFGEKAFEGVADYLAATVTEEDKIETAIGGVEGLLKSFQGDIDKRVNDAVAKAKKEKAPEKPENKPEPTNPDSPKDEVPAWAKALIDQNNALQDKIQSIESGKTFENRKSVLQSKLEKLSPEKKESILTDFEMMNFDSDESFQSYLAKKEDQVSRIIQSESNNGLKKFGPPIHGGGDTKKEPPKEQVKAIVGEIMKN